MPNIFYAPARPAKPKAPRPTASRRRRSAAEYPACSFYILRSIRRFGGTVGHISEGSKTSVNSNRGGVCFIDQKIDVMVCTIDDCSHHRSTISLALESRMYSD
jgi:hypothetical protein